MTKYNIVRIVLLYISRCVRLYMCLVTRKPVFVVFDKVSLKPFSPATETSYKIEISPVASLHIILSKNRITKALIRLRGCAGWSVPVLFRKPPKTGFLASRPISIFQKLNFFFEVFFTSTNSVNPAEMQHNAAFYLDLHGL